MKKLMLLLLPFSLWAQEIPLNTWRTHQTYRDAKTLVKTPNFIYVATSTGFFRIEPKTQKIQTLSPIDGLSDAVVSLLGYDSASNSLVIVYANGNIDVLTEKGIQNTNGLKLFNFPNKKFNHIGIDASKQKAYISANFGLIELDIKSLKITNSYLYTGNQATQIQFFATAVLNDSLYATTSVGFRKASLKRGINLADFRNWNLIPTPIPTQTKNLAVFNNQIFVAVNFDSLYLYQQGRLIGLNIAPRQNQYLLLKSYGNQLFLGLENLILVLEKDFSTRILDARNNQNFIKPLDLVVEENELGTQIWIADNQLGLCRLNSKTENVSYHNPNGVYAADVHQIIHSQNQILIAAGGYLAFALPQKNQNGFYVFQNGNWTSYNTKGAGFDTKKINFSTDITCATFDGKNWILGSYGGGLFRLEADSMIKLSSSLFYFIAAMTEPRNGKVYIARHPEGNGASVLELDLSTEKLNFISSPNFRSDQILLDNSGTIWMRNLNEIIALDPETGKTVSSNQSGSIFSGKLFTDMALSPNGSLWIATNDGIVEVINLSATVPNGMMAARFPRINQERALRNTYLNCIATDGGGRVWVGTNDGLRLFDAQVSGLISHFTASNSALLSDAVLKLGINPLSGEVFVATDKGLISYRSDASRVEFGANPNIQIFPNPVPSGFGGTIAITGLPLDGLIKITDSAGAMIRELKANGGTVGWDAKDYNGRKAKSGVYYVFAADVAGENGYLGKIALLE
jgi:ligand-binding sensor domain-containing protein